MTHPNSKTLDAGVFEQRLRALAQLADLTCRLAIESDLNQILNLVTSHVCLAVSCERASLFLYDETTRELFTQVATELEIAEIRHSIDAGIAGWVATRKQIANVPIPADDARWNSSVDLETGFRTESILAAPLISKYDERLVGVLELLNKQGGQFDDFDEHLLQAFATHAAVALEQSQLLRELKHSQMLEASIALARKIQASFLPQKLPVPAGYELAAWWDPAEAVAGDYYDVLQLPDGRLALALADVSGHGVGPSLIMAAIRAMLHVLVRTRNEPDQILTILSQTIEPDLNDGLFITFFLAALDVKEHRLTFANAGHFPVLHFQRSTGKFQSLERTGLPLGTVADMPYPAGRLIEMERGDFLVLATDGAVEQHNSEHEMFGVPRLEAVIAENCELPAVQVMERLQVALREFFTSAHPSDDISVLLIKRS